jgi:hypothetical protein
MNTDDYYKCRATRTALLAWGGIDLHFLLQSSLRNAFHQHKWQNPV